MGRMRGPIARVVATSDGWPIGPKTPEPHNPSPHQLTTQGGGVPSFSYNIRVILCYC